MGSVHKVLSSQYQYQVHSRSVDSWLADYCEEEQIKQDELDIEDTVKSLLKDKIRMEEKKKQKQMGDKKQVSIVESNELLDESARKRREKFKRQDTPLHPETTPLGSVKRL